MKNLPLNSGNITDIKIFCHFQPFSHKYIFFYNWIRLINPVSNILIYFEICKILLENSDAALVVKNLITSVSRPPLLKEGPV